MDYKGMLLRNIKVSHIITYIVAIALLSSLSFWRVLEFDFWRDDWRLLCSIENPTLAPTIFHKIELHGGTWIENALLFPLLGWNPFWWHVSGIGLRILSSISVALMVWALSRSKRIAGLAGLFFAVSFVGLETIGWPSAHVSSVAIILLGAGIYFWGSYLRENKSIDLSHVKNLILGFLLLEFAVLSSPSRSFQILVLLPILEFFFWWTSRKKEALRYIAARITALSCIIIISTIVLTSRLDKVWALNTDAWWYVQLLAEQPHLLKNYFTTIGGILFGWAVPIQESMGLAMYDNPLITKSAYFVIAIGGTLGLFWGLRKKSLDILLGIFFLLWMLISYAPGFIFFPAVLGGSHRYMAVSAVGLVGLFALVIGSIKHTPTRFTLVAIFITLNIITSNRILKQESTHRSSKVVENVLDRIVTDFPRHQYGSIVMLLGNQELQYSILEMPGSAVYSAKIHACGDSGHFFPTADKNLILQLLCGYKTEKPGAGALLLPPSPVPLSRVYAWRISGMSIENVSHEERERLREDAKILGCELNPE